MFAVLALFICCSISDAEGAVKIPLSEVWGMSLPGTRNVRDLEPTRKSIPRSDEEFIRTSIVEQIRQSLDHDHSPKKGEKARQAFIVAGTGLDALREAKDVLTGEKKRTNSVPANKEVTLVFYAYDPGRSLQLDEIVRQGDKVTVKYHLNIPEGFISKDYVPYLALVPLGKLPPSKIGVNMERLPDVGGTTFDRQRYSGLDNRVCDSFSFEVADATD
jgi:hypothetical protein